jgi:O-antigen/teichoic acid export membrane protein
VATARQIAWNTASQVAARVAAMAIGLATLVVVTRYLGVRAYGDLVAITVYVSVFGVFFDLGISTIVVRQLAQRQATPGELIGKVLTLRLALAVVVAAVAGLLTFAIYGGHEHHQLRLGMVIGLPIILASAVSSTVSTYFQAELKMARLAALEVGTQLFSLALVVLLVALDEGFYAIVAATVSATVFNALIALVLFRFLVPLRLQVDVTLWRRLFVQALPIGVALVLNVIYFRLDAFLLSVLKGPRDVGIYGIAFRFSEMLTPFPLFFVSSVFPVMATAVAAHNLEQLGWITQRAFDVLLLAAVPVVLGTIAIAPQIVRLVAGTDFSDAELPLRIVIFGTGVSFLATLFGYVLVALDRQRNGVWLSLLTLLVNLGLNLALIPPYGYVAAAAAASGTDTLLLIGLLLMVRRYSGVAPSLAIGAKALLAGAVMFGAVAAFHPTLPIAVALGAAVYGAGLYLLRVHEEIEIRRVLTRRAS